MQFLPITSMFLLVSGCLLQKESGVKVDFDARNETPTSFSDCVKSVGGVKHFNKSNYKTVLADFYTCRIHFGFQHTDKQPSYMRSEAAEGSNNEAFRFSRRSYDSIAKFMDLNRITCEKTEQQETDYALLRFKFPTKDVGHQFSNRRGK